MIQDLRFAIRQLRKSPGFALTTTLTLALGIGATTAIFSLINAVLLRPLPFPEPDRLVSVESLDTTTAKHGVPSSVSYPDFFDWRSRSHSFEGIATYHRAGRTLTGNGTPQQLETQTVSSDFFRVLGVNPMLGRVFVREDEKPGTRVVVLSHEAWQSLFGGDKNIVGRAITLDNNSYTVVGVMPKDFQFPIVKPAIALWTSLADDSDKGGLATQRGAKMLGSVARLRHGTNPTQAAAELSLIARNLAAQYPDSNAKFRAVGVTPEIESLVGDTRPALNVLFAAVLFVLLIACANVAGLMLARGARRRPEIALRAAIGASRVEIMRQVLVESIVLAICGGVVGVAMSIALLQTMLHLVPQNLPRLDQVSVDMRVLAFAAVVSVLTGMLFGVLPAFRMSRLDPALALREGTRSVTGGRGQHRLHGMLVIAETAIGLILLVGSGLLIHSFIRVLNVDAGFDSRHLMTGAINLPLNQYDGLKRAQFYDQLLPRLRALPGVESVAAGFPIPLSRNNIEIGFTIEGHPVSAADEPDAPVSMVTPDFFRTLRIPIIAGREFTDQDNSKAPSVVVVNQSFAHKYFPGENPIGKRIKPGLRDDITNDTVREIVGVVGDVKRSGLTTEMPAQFYLPLAQALVVSPSLIIRTSGDPTTILGPLRHELAQLDRNVPLYRISTVEDYAALSAAQPRFQTLLISFFAAIALLLSAIGLYAVLSYMVAQRTLEIGLRLALGAQRNSMLVLVVRRGMALALSGLAIGFVASLLLTRFMQGMLYGVRPTDPVTLIAVSALLLLVSLLASGVPAMRAARLDPMRTLREQ